MGDPLDLADLAFEPHQSLGMLLKGALQLVAPRRWRQARHGAQVE